MINEELWERCKATIPLRVPRNLPQWVGTVDGFRVLFADFNELKIRPDLKDENDGHVHMDCVEGANSEEAKWVRKEFGDDIILLDANLALRCLPYVLFHEATEAGLMKRRGLSYDQAHERANAAEKFVRQRDAAAK